MPNLSLLTSADAVKAAIAECDELGREDFLNRYGYRYSRLYPLHYDGRVYDSKAIAGVAFGKQHGVPLKAKEFSGGAATVVPVLGGLGFPVRQTPHPVESLVIGTTYYRKDLLEQYGGQLQKGIWTPREFPVVFIFTGDSGKTFGYRDGWTEDGVFRYTGEGQSGDMTFTNGNEAIRDHRQNGKDLLLFEDLGKGKGVRTRARSVIGRDRVGRIEKPRFNSARGWFHARPLVGSSLLASRALGEFSCLDLPSQPVRLDPSVEGIKVNQHLSANLQPHTSRPGAVALDDLAAAVLAVKCLELQIPQAGCTIWAKLGTLNQRHYLPTLPHLFRSHCRLL